MSNRSKSYQIIQVSRDHNSLFAKYRKTVKEKAERIIMLQDVQARLPTFFHSKKRDRLHFTTKDKKRVGDIAERVLKYE